MQERKNKTLLISLLALTAIAAILLFTERQSVDVDKDLFRIEDLSVVDKIELQHLGDKVVLEFDGTRWLVNGKDDADDRLVTVLFATLGQVEIKRPVANKIVDSIRLVIANQGVSVTLSAKGEMVKELQVGGNPSKTESYIQDAVNGPFIMAIPGYRVYAAGIFELEALGWREKRIFNFNWRNFKSLSTSFASSENQDFSITNTENGFDINGAVDTDTTKLNDYLDAVSLLAANQFIAAGHSKIYDSLINTNPTVKIEILDIGNNQFSLELYRPITGDINVLGKMADGTLSLFTREQVIPILKVKNYFRSSTP